MGIESGADFPMTPWGTRGMRGDQGSWRRRYLITRRTVN